MSSVSAVFAANTTNAASAQKSQNPDFLGKDAFLQLLVTQMRYQDPLSPMDDKQFISQMAQFSALEQTQNLNGQIQRLNALAMLGRNVIVQPDHGNEPVLGIVERVVTLNGVTRVLVDGVLYGTDQVSAVE